MTAKKLIAANWKMNLSFNDSREWMEFFLKEFSAKYEEICDVVICPQSILITDACDFVINHAVNEIEKFSEEENIASSEIPDNEYVEMIKSSISVSVGAQNCYSEDFGAFTGEVSPECLASVGVKYVILGHSERRSIFGETDKMIMDKVIGAVSNNLIPILCVGETKESRDQNTHYETIYKQLISCIPQDVRIPELVIAYEPIWAIGTGVVPSIEEIEEAVSFIREAVGDDEKMRNTKVSVIYGGSVNSDNSGQILKVCDGLLVGKASLDPNEFLKIVASC